MYFTSVLVGRSDTLVKTIISFGWIGIKLCTVIHAAQKVNHNDTIP